MTFHAKLGSQGDRVRRLVRLAGEIAPLVGADAGAGDARGAAAKADLTTGMVGEFPELQGVMGRYYALHDGEDAGRRRRDARPLRAEGPGRRGARRTRSASPSRWPTSSTSSPASSRIGEKPTGSGDPYALRRAALGVIRIMRERRAAAAPAPLFSLSPAAASSVRRRLRRTSCSAFLADRLRVQLRAEGARHDVLAAVFAAGADDDLVRLLARTDAVAALLGTEDGANLLAGLPPRRQHPAHRGTQGRPARRRRSMPAPAASSPRNALWRPHWTQRPQHRDQLLAAEAFADAMAALAALRAPLDAFFDKVTVNDPRPELRRNRLRLLARVRATMNRVADFSKIEG